MAIWAAAQGYPGTASFFYAQAAEERSHMLKIIDYMVLMGEAPQITLEPIPQKSYTTIQSLFEQMLAQEQAVTKKIHQIGKAASSSHDFSTLQFLQWFFQEQREEEASAERGLELCQSITPTGAGLYILDQAIKELNKRST